MATTSALDFPPKFWPAQVDHDLLVPILLANAVSYILLGSLVTKVRFQPLVSSQVKEARSR